MCATGRNLKFTLKTVSEKTVERALSSMNRKKSSGIDGLSQDKLIMAKEILKIPLTRLINESIEKGEFPKTWKEAVITPILKKGDKTKKENYRPVSCLSVASKVLEKIVCEQTTEYMEKNKLFPENQHGFRKNRSTMTALAAVQQRWVEKTESKEVTGILLWDLTAAYDTLDAELLCEKMKLYGFCERTRKWFGSFLTGRKQRVKIGTAMSAAIELDTGVPQGSILSPVLFIIYVADMEDWTKHAGVYTYADDTSTDASSKEVNEVITKLEEDAETILQFMASNGLVANPQKTTFMLLGKEKGEKQVKVGDVMIAQSETAKLLGMVIDEKQKWKPHVETLVKTLDKRLFTLRRIEGKISDKGLKKVADSLWSSKMRYGLQLYQEVRTTDEQTKSNIMTMLQKAQNRMLRTLTGTWQRDRVRIKDLLEITNILSVNQQAAQIKLSEMWKATKLENYPVKMEKLQTNGQERATRQNKEDKFKEKVRTKLGMSTFVTDGARLWNRAPKSVTSAGTMWQAKKAIKEFCKTLPI